MTLLANPSASGAPLEYESPKPPYPPGFRPHRGLNWGYLGLLYTSFYLCRFNLTVANKTIADEYHFSYSQMSRVIFTSTLIYAFGQIINGLLTDRIGGKKAMLIGAAGTVTMNLLFGAASAWGTLGLFVAIRGMDGYFQSFGAPGMTKIKTAWFAKTERGGFAGIFGFMINLGRLGIFNFGPALLVGFTIFGVVHVSPLHWKWLFWGPSIVCAVVAVCMAFGVKETPEEHGYLPIEDYSGNRLTEGGVLKVVIMAAVLTAGGAAILWLYHINKLGPMDVGIIAVVFIVTLFIVLHYLAGSHPPPAIEVAAPPIVPPTVPLRVAIAEPGAPLPVNYASSVREPEAYDDRATRTDILSALRTIVVNPAVWVVAAAYACTGAVRNPVDSWFARYMQEAHHTGTTTSLFLMLAFLIPCAGSAGSLLSGFISDKLFAGARSPVAAGLYALEIGLVGLATLFSTTPAAAVFFLVALSFTANATHSILGTAAAMDIGGRKMTGFASGLIDSFQYFGATLGLMALGWLLDKYGWKAFFPYMLPFGVIGMCLMIFGRGIIERNSTK